MATDQARKFIGKLWATTGLREDPEDVGITRTQGWDIRYEQPWTRRYPELKVFQQCLRELQGLYAEILVWGGVLWDPLVDFNVGAVVIHDSKRWFSTRVSGPANNTAIEPGTTADANNPQGPTWRRH